MSLANLESGWDEPEVSYWQQWFILKRVLLKILFLEALSHFMSIAPHIYIPLEDWFKKF